MKKIEVKIHEKDKGLRNLSLLNLREEVVNFLYKDTVANSTKADLHFFVLLYFICIPYENSTFLEKILDDGIPKFKKLNEAFAKNKGYLRAHQYRKMVEEHGLSELFKNDIFFVLIESILSYEEIKERYGSFLKKHAEINKVISTVQDKYFSQLTESLAKFSSSKIEDDRYDERGNHHDLSKSVYRTVRMRNSRNLDLNLQKYTSIKEITSKSPIDLTFLQYVDPQIIFDLWDKYHVAYYMRSVWRVANNAPIVADAIGSFLGGLPLLYLQWKLIDGNQKRKEKESSKQVFEDAKNKNGQVLDDLTLRLVDSVLKANERLEKDIDILRDQVKAQIKDGAVINEKKMKMLEKRITELQNLSVSAQLIDEKNKEERKNVE